MSGGGTGRLIEGFLESIGDDHVHGWCFDRAAPSHHLDVELVLAGKVIATTLACERRPHLTDAGIGNGDHGFCFLLTTKLSLDHVARLVVRVRDPSRSGVVLPRLEGTAPTIVHEPVDMVRPRPNNQRIRHCILHIGMEKTGSTSLQRFIGINRQALLRQGILVPRALAPHAANDQLNHILLATAAMDLQSDSAPLRARFGIVGEAAVRRHRIEAADSLGAEIQADGGSCHTLLLSSEHCQSRLKHVGEVGRLREFLMSFCDTVQVVLYLRSQIEVALSAYGTILKDGAVNLPILPRPGQPDDDIVAQFYDYERLVSRWEQVFGAANLDVRLYAKETVDDFLTRLSLDVQDFSALKQWENRGLDYVAELVLAALNRSLSSRCHAEAQRVRDMLIEALEATHTGRGACPSREEADAFQRRFDASNERLRARRFPDQAHLFAADPSIYGNEPPTGPSAKPQGLAIGDMATMMVDVLDYIARR